MPYSQPQIDGKIPFRQFLGISHFFLCVPYIGRYNNDAYYMLGFWAIRGVDRVRNIILGEMPMLRKTVEYLGILLHRVFLTLLTILAVVAILLTIAHITRTLGKTPYKFVEWLPNQILAWFGTSSTALIANKTYEIIVADMIAVCAFVFAVAPAVQAKIYKINLKRTLRKRYGLEVFKVRHEGVDDLKKMLECYEGAEHITVFCGDYDWLQPDNLKRRNKFKASSIRLQNKIKTMTRRIMEFVLLYAKQGKITLVSSRGEQAVRDALHVTNNDTLFDTLENCFKFDESIEIKCSLIKHIHNKYTFLYRSHSDDKGHLFNAHVFVGAEEGGELINILRNLVECGWTNRD